VTSLLIITSSTRFLFLLDIGPARGRK